MSAKTSEAIGTLDPFDQIQSDLNQEITSFPDLLKDQINANLQQTKSIISYFQDGESGDLPDYFDLSNDLDDVDQGHLAKLFLKYPDAENIQLVMGTAYLMRSLYNQVKLSRKSLTQMNEEVLQTYKQIAPIIFGDSNIRERNYTDNRQAKELLVKHLKQLNILPESIVGVPSVGQGHTELAALGELGIPLDQIYANDLLPFTSLYPEFANENLEKLHANGHLSWHDVREFCKLHPEQFDVVISAGSSFNNSENAADPLDIFIAINKSLKECGTFIYETRNFDTSSNNPIRHLSDEYLSRHKGRPPGSKPVHSDYLMPGENPDSFGAMLHSDIFVRAIARLAGFESILVPSEQIWSPTDGVYRSIYMFKKTGNPDKLSMLILKSFQSAFARRFPEDAGNPSPIS